MTPTIAILGCGHLGSAIATRLLKSTVVSVSLNVADPNPSKLDALSNTVAQTTTDSAEAVANADTVILAMKPYAVEAALRNYSTQLVGKLVISVAAGVSIARLSSHLARRAPIVRCMPNILSSIGAGISGVFANPYVTPEQKQLVASLMQALGNVLWLESESQLHTVTALSGSGPGYIFYIINAMIQAGCHLGLDRSDSEQLVVQTTLGAAKLVRDSRQSPFTLQEQVATSGGTTEQGLKVLTTADVHNTIIQAVEAAHARSIEIAEEI